MWRFLKNLALFRMGQRTARGTARMLGYGKLGLVIGLIGGWRMMRRHRHA